MTRTSTRKILKEHGFEGDLNDFRDVLVVTLHNFRPDWNDQKLSNNPDDAKQYCNIVRHAAKTPRLHDEVIMGALHNIRKHVITC